MGFPIFKKIQQKIAKREIRYLLQSKGILILENEKVMVKDRKKALLLSDTLRNFHEVYFAAICAAREKVLENTTGNSSKRAGQIADEMIASGRFIKPEAISKSNIKNALDVFKDLKILRPTSEQQPYSPQGLGTRIYDYLDAATKND